MRPDIKLGIVISMVVVFVAGSYFMYRANDEAPVPLTSATGEPKNSKTVTDPAPKKATKAPTAKRSPRRTAKKNQSPAVVRSKSPATSKAKKAQTAKNSRRNAGSHLPNSRSPARMTGSKRAKPKAKTPSKQLANNEAATKNSSGNPASNKPRTAQRMVLRPQNQATKNQGSSSPITREQKQPVSLAARPANSNHASQHQGNNGESIETHRVQPGDTFAALAQRYYGNQKHARFLINRNPHLGTSGRLLTGQIVKIPSLPGSAETTRSVARTSGAPRTGRTYTVKSGDSFYKIAANVLGDASRWNELFELNKALVKGDPKRLRIGAEIKLPN